MNYAMHRLLFTWYTLYWYARINIDLIKAFFLRNTLVAIIFFVQWIFGNVIWYYIAIMNWGWWSWFARVYLAFLWSPLAIEKAVYLIIAIWLSKVIMNLKKKSNK